MTLRIREIRESTDSWPVHGCLVFVAMAPLRRKVSPISKSAITFTVSVVDVPANKNCDIGPCLQNELRIMEAKAKTT